MYKKNLLSRVSTFASLVVGESVAKREAELEAMRKEHDEKLKKAHHPMPMRRPGNISYTSRRWKPDRKLVVIEENVAQHTNREGKKLTHKRLVRESETKVRMKVLPTPVHRAIDLLFAKKARANVARAEAGRWCN